MQTDRRAGTGGRALSMAALGPEGRGGLSCPVVLGGPRGGGEPVIWCRHPQVVPARGCDHSAGQAPRDRLGVELCPFLSLAAWGPPSPHPRPKSWYKAGPAGVCGGGGAGTPRNGQGSKYRDTGGPGCRPRAALSGRCRAAHAGPCLAARGRRPALSCPRAQGSAGHRRAVFSACPFLRHGHGLLSRNSRPGQLARSLRRRPVDSVTHGAVQAAPPRGARLQPPPLAGARRPRPAVCLCAFAFSGRFV